MPTFHTLDEALKDFDEKFYSIPDKTCLWHRNVDLKQFLSLVWQSAEEKTKKEIRSNIGMLRQWLNEKDRDLIVTSEMIETFLFPITSNKEKK